MFNEFVCFEMNLKVIITRVQNGIQYQHQFGQIVFTEIIGDCWKEKSSMQPVGFKWIAL